MNANFLTPQLEYIPDTLKQQPWGVWKAEPREGALDKFNKAPRCPITGRKIGANQPEKFGTFNEAKAAYETGQYTGLGIVLNGSGIVGVDIDDYADIFSLRPDVKAWANQAIKQGVYCEKSPSGKGLRLFMIGKLPTSGRKSAGLEIYNNTRFLTVTGQVIHSCSSDAINNHLTHGQELIDEFLSFLPSRQSYFATDPNSLGIQLRTGILFRSDIPSELQEKLPELFSAFPLLVGERWRDLYNGDISSYDNDKSRADLALAGFLARAGCTPDEIDQVMRTSALYRDKWEELRGNSTWLHNTIALAWSRAI